MFQFIFIFDVDLFVNGTNKSLKLDVGLNFYNLKTEMLGVYTKL